MATLNVVQGVEALETVGDRSARKGRHLCEFGFGDAGERSGDERAMRGCRTGLAIIHPGIAEEILSPQCVLNAAMDIQDSFADVKIAIDIRIEPIVCGTAPRVDLRQIVNPAVLTLRELNIERCIGTSGGICVAHRDFDSLPQFDRHQPISDQREIEIAGSINAVGGRITESRIGC